MKRMNREILRLALPNIVSNITVPLMGIVSTAIAGHWGQDSAATIGALAIGVSIFNFIYWNCSFVRMGTSGLTAQAFGAGNFRECTNMLARALSVAGIMGAAMLLLQYPLGELALWAMNGGEMTRAYFYTRIWAVPAGILLFGFNGWFTGMQNALFPMITAVTVNLIHLACSLAFAFGLDLGIVGIAWASVVAQWCGVGLATVLLIARYRSLLTSIRWSEVLDVQPLRRFFVINRDIILRTLCIVAVYTFFTGASARTFFTGASARMEDRTLLAVNALLLELFTLFSYMNDGFAYAAEALTGRFIGARDRVSLGECLHRCLLWGTLVSVVFVGIYLVWWRDLVGLFVDRALHRLDHPDPHRLGHALHHGRNHGRRHRDARHAQLDVRGHGRLFRHLLRPAAVDRQQRTLARLHALHVPAGRPAIHHDPRPADHPRKGVEKA